MGHLLEYQSAGESQLGARHSLDRKLWTFPETSFLDS